MMGFTHSTAAVAAWAGACAITHPGPVILLGGAAVAATVAPWPDIDNPGAWARRRRRRHGQLIRWRAHPVKYRISQWVAMFGDHREGPAHSILILPAAAALLAIPLPWITWWPLWLPAAAAIGLCSHPILDLMNRQPVRITWPIGPLWQGLGIRVGGPGEAVTRFLLLLAIAPLAWLALT